MNPTQRVFRMLRLGAALLVVTACTAEVAGENPKPFAGTEILFDKYGVPHIFSDTREGMFYGQGYAQMQNHPSYLLQLYGESRGIAASYWGDEFLALDRWLQLNNMPERAKQWYDAQDPTFKKYWDEFARGINDYAKDHPDKIDAKWKVVLPVTGVDVVGHSLRVVYYGYIATQAKANNEAQAYMRANPGEFAQVVANFTPAQLAEEKAYQAEAELAAQESNTWTVGPSHSASGESLMLINPHLAWGNTFYRYTEVHMVGPDFDFFGGPQVGFPVGVVGFNRHTGWGRTVNTIDNVDFFRITVQGNQYMYDGQLRNFETQTKTIRSRQADGSFKTETLNIRRTVHGPVVYDQNGLVLAMKVAGLDRPRLMEQWFKQAAAKNLAEFEDALRMVSVPLWHVNYADDEGHIMLVFNGIVARRNGGTYAQWNAVQPGDKSDNHWNSYLTYEELPKSKDPAAGWNQNANEPPWQFTLPVLDRTKFPTYIAPDGLTQPAMRTLRSINKQTHLGKITLQQFVDNKHSTVMELTERVMPDLTAHARMGSPGATAAAEAMAVLNAWDHKADVDSKGAVLFQAFADDYLLQGIAGKMRVPFDINRPNETAMGLKDPEAALVALAATAQRVKTTWGRLDIPYGEVYRIKTGNRDLPANGGSGPAGLFRTLTFTRQGQGAATKFYANHGETIVCGVQFSTPQVAQCLLGYGNSSEPGNPHLEDQLQFMTDKKLLPFWRERSEIEANLESRVQLPTTGGN